MKTRFILLFSMIAFLTGCQNSDTIYQIISLEPTIQSRVAMESGFITNDAIGVFMLNRTIANSEAPFTSVTGNYIDNAAYTYSAAGKWSFTQKYYWKDGDTNSDIIAYYPYATLTSSISPTAFPISLPTNQSTEARLRQSDFLYCKVAKVNYNNNYSSGIPLVMTHKLCKINVFFNVESIDISNSIIKIQNVSNEGTINLSSGDVAVNTTSSSITPFLTTTERKAECIVMPQTLTAYTDFIDLIYKNTNNENVELAYRLAEDLTLVGGKEYNFTFTYTENNQIRTTLIINDLNK